MRRIRRKLIPVAALALATLLGTGGCGWVGSDADGGPPSTQFGPQVVDGRPWRRGRRRRPTVARARWGRAGGPTVAGLHPDESQALARAWARAGEFEHASIAAFVDLAADLRAHGAPADLVHRCEAAADDERDHTDRCFALASRYAGRPVQAGRARHGAARVATPIEVLATEALRDGLLNEGVAALLAAEQLRSCTDAAAAATLEVVARDEAVHAELGRAILDWCLEVGGSAVERAVAAALADLPVPAVPPLPAGLSTATAEAHGRGVPAGLAARLHDLHADVRANQVRVPA